MLHKAGNRSIYNGVLYPKEMNGRAKEAGSPRQRASPAALSHVHMQTRFWSRWCEPADFQAALPIYCAARPNPGQATSPSHLHVKDVRQRSFFKGFTDTGTWAPSASLLLRSFSKS